MIKTLELQNKSIELLTIGQEQTSKVILQMNERIIELEMRFSDEDYQFLKKVLIN